MVIEQSSAGDPWDTIASVLNWLTWAVFVLNVVVMLALVDDRLGWARKNVLEIVLVILTPPLLPPGLQSLRVLRLLRLLRLAVLAKAARRLFTADGLRFGGLLALLTAVGGAAAFEAAERHEQAVSFGDSLWS